MSNDRKVKVEPVMNEIFKPFNKRVLIITNDKLYGCMNVVVTKRVYSNVDYYLLNKKHTSVKTMIERIYLDGNDKLYDYIFIVNCNIDLTNSNIKLLSKNSDINDVYYINSTKYVKLFTYDSIHRELNKENIIIVKNVNRYEISKMLLSYLLTKFCDNKFKLTVNDYYIKELLSIMNKKGNSAEFNKLQELYDDIGPYKLISYFDNNIKKYLDSDEIPFFPLLDDRYLRS